MAKTFMYLIIFVHCGHFLCVADMTWSLAHGTLHWLPGCLHRTLLAAEPPCSQTRDVSSSCAVPPQPQFSKEPSSVGGALWNPLSKHYGCHLLWGCHTNNLRLPILLKSANTKFTATSTFHVNTDVIKFR